MAETLQHFEFFLLAVVHQYFVLAAGGVLTVMIALIERHILKRQISYKAEIFVLLFFLFIACFGAWNEQYKLTKPPATQPITVNVSPQPPVQVNVPAPIVNLPPEMAYMGSADISILANAYHIGGVFAVNAVCKNISPTAVARDAVCIRALRVVDTKLNAQQQPIVAEKIQEDIWNQFQKDARTIPTSRMTYGPLESKLGSVISPTVDASMDTSFRNGTKTVLYLGEYTWTDGTGYHVDDVCTWLEMYPGIFSAPGVMTVNAQLMWNNCNRHNGLRK